MKRKTTIACVGDSITYGETLQDRSVQNYPSRLGVLLGEDFEVVNLGRNGAGLWSGGGFPYTETDEYRRALVMRADCYVICLGTNDIIYGVSDSLLKAFEKDYLSLICSFKLVFPGARVIVCTLPPVPCMRVNGSEEAIGKLNDAIAHIATANGLTLVDLYEVFRGKDYLFTDGVHPNSEGAGVIVDMIYEALSA